MQTGQNHQLVEQGSRQENLVDSIERLFRMSNERFFWKKLAAVQITWSDCTTCPAQASYSDDNGVCLTLNEAMLVGLLQQDTANILLHEMIHAYLMLTESHRDRNAHSTEFRRHMHRINRESGTNVTISHGFLPKYSWQCVGACRYRKPSFGVVRKVVDEPPGPNDEWWTKHEATCGGIFIKAKDCSAETSVNNDTRSDMKFLIRPPGFGRWKEKYYSKSFQEYFTKYLDNSQLHSAFLTTRYHWQSEHPNLNEDAGNTAATADKCVSENSCGEALDVEMQSEFQTLSVGECISTNEFSNSIPAVDVKTCSGEIDNFKECIVCCVRISCDLYGEHVTKCLGEIFRSDFSYEDAEKSTQCTPEDTELKAPTGNPCSENAAYQNHLLQKSKNSPHRHQTLNTGRSQSDTTNNLHDHTTCISNVAVNADRVCPVCNTDLQHLSFDKHVDTCLGIKGDLMENSYVDVDADVIIKCHGCCTNIKKSQLELHMEECLAAIFKDSFSLDLDQGYRYDCPFCFKLYSETELRCHVSTCARILEDAAQSQSAEKVFLLHECFDEMDFPS